MVLYAEKYEKILFLIIFTINFALSKEGKTRRTIFKTPQPKIDV